MLNEIKNKETTRDIKNGKCRFCNSDLVKTFVNLGASPLANSFLDDKNLEKQEHSFPLHVFVCSNCLLVQLEEFESPEKIFSDYAYFSSYSSSWLKHAKNYVNTMIRRFELNKKSLVIEIASNDGYLLQYFKEKDIPVLGIEPAENVAKVAEEKGIPTLVKFFGFETAQELISEGKSASLIIGNNVLAHVPNLNDFVKGMKTLLKPNGIITMEFPHLLQLMGQNQFDTIYHEHFSYFSLLTVQKIFSFHDLVIFDVEELPTHGGSLRIFVKHHENDNFEISSIINILLEKERKFGLEKISTYENFQEKINQVRKNIRSFFIDTKVSSKKVICYGAPAKGNTLLNYCDIGLDFVEYTVDLNKHKQGLYLPGTHIPIKNPDVIRETKPDYIVILPWNLKEEIMEQMKFIRNWGGKFVVLIPDVRIFD